LEFWDDIEGVERLFFRFVGDTRVWADERLWENEGEDLSIDAVEILAEVEHGSLVLEEEGSGKSSTEKIERSSPFQKSPH
jgi:hypothetical protein